MKGKSRGFTLLETMVVVAIGIMIVGAAGPAVFQVMTGSERSHNRVTAVLQVQRAGYWISNDALKSQVTDVGGGNGFRLTLKWSQVWPQKGKNDVITYVSTEYEVKYTLELDPLNLDYGELTRHEKLETNIYDDAGQLVSSTNSNANTVVAQYLTAAEASFIGSILAVNVTARFPLTGDRYVAEETRVYEIRPRLQQ